MALVYITDITFWINATFKRISIMIVRLIRGGYQSTRESQRLATHHW